MNVVIILWAHEQPEYARIDVLERDSWFKENIKHLQRGRGLTLPEFFYQKQIPIEKARVLLHDAPLRLVNENTNDQRLNLNGWREITCHNLTPSRSDMQRLANYLGATVWLYKTNDKRQRIPELEFCCTP